ncbi:hypothetical protein V494_00491 [Pseudogymnoascus sp. VKM F-4513 (FW-928)]|nr:hypothetical protein V494_00491 [Pseudogymnoascus sp. VKM F-4513 (FW-928)]
MFPEGRNDRRQERPKAGTTKWFAPAAQPTNCKLKMASFESSEHSNISTCTTFPRVVHLPVFHRFTHGLARGIGDKMEGLWNNPNYQNTGAPAGPIHDDRELCMHLLQSLPSSAPIELGPSTLHSGGTGLFARKPIRGGKQILRSKPLVCCVADDKRTTICDYCYTDRFNPQSYFGYQGQNTNKMFMCPGCDMTGYCSVVRAWVEYHEYECWALATMPYNEVYPRMVYRVIALYKERKFSAQEWRALCYLWGHSESNTPSGIDYPTMGIYAIYTAAASNAKRMEYPLEESPGIALDLVASFANHSCNPNAFIFFERNQLRMRSLRPIRAGEEITLSYIDLGAGIRMRDETLKNGYSIVCECSRCRRETAELSAIAHSRGFDINIFALSDFKFAAFKERCIFKHNMFDMIPNMQEHPDDIVTSSNNDLFAIYPWPSTIFPMAYLQFYYARLYRTISEHRTAVMYALQGCFGMITRSGPEWLTFLHVLVMFYGHALRMLLPMADDLDEAQQKRYEDFYLGLVHELLVRARKMYGSDSRYTVAVKEYYDAAMRDAMVLDANATLPGTQGFRQIFDQAQINVLTLAGVDPTTGIGLSQLSAWRGETEVRLWNGTEYVDKQV